MVGITSKTVFEPVINAAGELIGAREIVNGQVTTRIHRAWVSVEGMRLVHYSDDKVYLLHYRHELVGEQAAQAMRGLRFYQAADSNQMLVACAFWPAAMDPYLLCFGDGGAVMVRAHNTTHDRGVEQLLVEGAHRDYFTVTRIPNPWD